MLCEIAGCESETRGQITVIHDGKKPTVIVNVCEKHLQKRINACAGKQVVNGVKQWERE